MFVCLFVCLFICFLMIMGYFTYLQREHPTHICHLAARAGTRVRSALLTSFIVLTLLLYLVLCQLHVSCVLCLLVIGVRASIEDPFIYVHSNIEGTTRMLDLARRYCCRNFVYASSSSVYG